MHEKTCVIIFLLILLASFSHASMPVMVTITGCVTEGVFVSTETDYGTYKVRKYYRIRVMDEETKSPLDMTPYNNNELRIKGYILPCDLFFVDKKTIERIGSCGQKGELSTEEQDCQW